MIARDPEAAARARWDLAVVGGGVYGIALTLEAARRGIRTLLVERDDFGGATSWNSLRIVHGGLRALQTLDLHRFREMVLERRWWLATFPDLVEPLPCLMPLGGRGLHRPGVLRLALAVNDLLSHRRNRGVAPDRALPGGRVLGASEALERCPALEGQTLSGAALWHDGAMPDSHRLLIEMLRWAAGCGAAALNYAEATRLRVGDGRVAGLEILDRESGRGSRIDAPVVVNCGGPWCRELARAFDRDHPELFHLSLAFNVLLDRPAPCEAALAVTPPAPGARTYFLVPWKGRLLAGTGHAPWPGRREEGTVEPARLRRFLDEINAALPGLDLRPADAFRIFWGFLPARRPGSEELAVREVVRHHGERGGPEGLWSVSGVKFTTARRVAERTLRRIRETQREPLPDYGDDPRPEPSPTLPWRDFEALAEAGDPRARENLRRLLAEESAIHLEDLMLRRTDWGFDPRQIRQRAERVALLLGWDAARIAAELRRLEDRGLSTRPTDASPPPASPP